MKKYLPLLFLLLFINCDKDETQTNDQNQEVTIIEGGVANTYEIKSVEINNLTQDRYTGNIGNVPIIAISNANKLTLQIPQNAPLGNQKIIFDNLDLEIHYNIIKTKLQQSPDLELAAYLTNLTDFQNNVDQSPEGIITKEYLDSFIEYLSSLNISEKEVLALNYKANKEFFDYMLTNNFSRTLIDGTDLEILGKMYLAGGVFIVASLSAYTALTAQLYPATAFFALAASVAWYKYKKYNFELDNRNIKIIGTLIDGIQSFLEGRNSNSTLELVSGELSEFPLESERRAIIVNDFNNGNENISKFFGTISSANDVIDKINEAIDYINNNTFFSNISNIPISIINQNNPVTTALENEAFFNRYNFSIESSNVTLNNISFTNGNFSIIATINDTSIVDDFMETHLNFTYEDDFNKFLGFFPIKIFVEPQEFDPTISNWDVCLFEIIDGPSGGCTSGNGNGCGWGTITFTTNHKVILANEVYPVDSSSWEINGNNFRFTYITNFPPLNGYIPQRINYYEGVIQNNSLIDGSWQQLISEETGITCDVTWRSELRR